MPDSFEEKVARAEYCRRDAEVSYQLAQEFSRYCFWRSPQWIADNPDRVRVDEGGTQHFYK